MLSRTDDVDLAELLQLVAGLCDADAAGITIRRGDDYHVPLTHGIEPFVCPADDTFCTWSMGEDGVVTVPDALADPRFAHIGWVDGRRAHARSYASAPLYAPDGRMVGRLCVIDARPRELSALQQRSLEAMALSVTQLIELRLRRDADRGRATHDPATRTVVTQLTAELCHDLRVPLSALAAGTELLEDQLASHPDRAVAALLTRMRSASERMGRMIDTHLTLDDRAGERVPVDLGRVLEQLVSDSAPLLDPLGAVVEARNLPVVTADGDDMYSVLQNLLTNAVKFARPDAPAWVRVSAARRPGGWRVTVRDNGRGIDPARREQVFALFSRGDHEVEGHGIGLATVARLVHAHDGEVGIEAAPDGGTEVWFELPDRAGLASGP